MTRCRLLLALVLSAVLAAACADTRGGAPTNSPTGPSGPTGATSPAPTAVLSIDSGAPGPALGLVGITSFVFDASQSTGEGLTYLIDYGDGISSSAPISTHVFDAVTRASGPFDGTVRLTVTDRMGRSASTTSTVAVRDVTAWSTANWHWENAPYPMRTHSVTLRFTVNGPDLTGWYVEDSTGFRVQRRMTGTVTSPRTVTMRTTDGYVELSGEYHWFTYDVDDDPYTDAVLSLNVRGGIAHGTLRRFDFHDPY